MIKKWKEFNEELNPFTYRKAGQKLKKMGHTKRSERLFAHSEDMHVKNSEKYGIGEVEFQNGVMGKFAGFDLGVSWDVYLDSEYKYLSFPLFFKFPDSWDGSTILCPISFEYDIEDDKLELYSYSEEALDDLYGVSILKFKNRKDVMKVISAIKNLDLKSEIKGDYSKEDFDNYESSFKKMLSKLKVNELYQ